VPVLGQMQIRRQSTSKVQAQGCAGKGARTDRIEQVARHVVRAQSPHGAHVMTMSTVLHGANFFADAIGKSCRLGRRRHAAVVRSLRHHITPAFSKPNASAQRGRKSTRPASVCAVWVNQPGT
jgi:hypothetical protein